MEIFLCTLLKDLGPCFCTRGKTIDGCEEIATSLTLICHSNSWKISVILGVVVVVFVGESLTYTECGFSSSFVFEGEGS